MPREILASLAAMGVLGMVVPEAYGGSGLGVTAYCKILEEIAYHSAAIAVTVGAHQSIGMKAILLFGTEEQKRVILPPLASGAEYAAFALTGPGAGSDAGSIQTTAVPAPDGDGWILNGTKQWITNAGEAEFYTIIAVTDPNKGARGASAFLVEKNDPGISFGKKEKKMGIRASVTREVVLEDCRIPKDRLLGKEGLGFIITMKTLDLARPGAGSLAVGLAQGALDEAGSFAKERHQFGAAIFSFQAVQHMLADMATRIEAARALVYSVARFVDSKPKDYSKEGAMAKLFPTDMAMQVTIDAVQVMGGHGYMREYPVEKMMRDAKILQIFEGTNQIMRNIIGLALNKEYARKK